MGSVNETLPVMLSSGSNTIPVPAGAEGVIIKPADSNTVALSLFGVLPINPAVACLVPFDPGAIPASLTIVAAGALAKPVMLFFF